MKNNDYITLEYIKDVIFNRFESGFQYDYPDFNAFELPEPLIRVTGGNGGESFLIISEKVALYDTGMAAFSDILIRNIHDILDKKGKTLDYVFLSHTHYDHIGALPYILEEWPAVQVFAAAKAVQVFESIPAKRTMLELGQAAKERFGGNVDIKVDPLRVDHVLNDGESISLGNGMSIKAIESKGHTDCSLSFMIEPQMILIACESTGCPIAKGVNLCSPLKSVDKTIETAKKLKNSGFKTLIAAHFGKIPEEYTPEFMDDYIRNAELERDFIAERLERGMHPDDIYEEHKTVWFSEDHAKHQPEEAYEINTRILINQIAKSKGISFN